MLFVVVVVVVVVDDDDDVDDHVFEETLSVLMPCAPCNRRRPFSCHTKMADFEYFRVLFVFSWKKLA